MKDCPCGTGFLYIDCCGPLIRGVGHADTAEDFMRSRFTAFALGHWDYLENSLHPEERTVARDGSQQQKEIHWTRLEIHESKKGGAFDEEGEVSFTAHFTQNGESKTLQETSKFLKLNGEWYYSQRASKVMSSVFASSAKPFQRNQPKIGRNDPCPCSSGKKFKKCCGK